MLSGELWPAHPHPYPGECLSSWIVRTAHHNGLKLQTFSDIVFGKSNQIWNRDLDRLAPGFVLQIMSNRASISLKEANKSTLKLYTNRLFPTLKPSGILRWTNPLVLHHRKHTGFGMQFCPLCLLEDSEPYFRIAWRLSLYTFCPIHQVMMEDHCPCGASVNFHRIELGKANQFEPSTLDECYQCSRLLSSVEPRVIQLLPMSVYTIWNRVLRVITRGFVNSGPINYERLILLHQICKIIVSPRFNRKIKRYICDTSGLPTWDIGIHRYFEQYDVDERHYVLKLAWWLVGNTNKKLKESIRRKFLQHNYLYRDSSDLFLRSVVK
ncbi:TniQ family protein [Thalassotalea profundi]|uniref:TniQ domain-containing protein n=1 Tax=Thalassotalea profundi TaxID=2036687 RepID=A0ABQ3IIE4_9GAMM|nr:TniQ family protein [Thalassotalea profundi]GHE80232.1 hypothetical protein GCM10011501_05090 [Thalassotalea profundi]